MDGGNGCVCVLETMGAEAQNTAMICPRSEQDFPANLCDRVYEPYAGSEARLLSLSNALDGLRVADLMRLHPLAAQADLTLRDFMTEVAWDDDSVAYPVLDGLRPIGILPSRNVARTPSGEWSNVRVRDRMLPLDRVPVLKPDDPAVEAMRALVGAGADSALVLDHGRLDGIVYTHDLADVLESGRRRPWRRQPAGSRPAATVVPFRPRAVPSLGRPQDPPREAA